MDVQGRDTYWDVVLIERSEKQGFPVRIKLSKLALKVLSISQ